jgi:hypothetical protein
MLSILAVRLFILCSSLLLKTFANTNVLISAGTFVFEAANCVRQDVLLEEGKRLAVGFRDVLNLCEFRGTAVQNRGLRTLQILSFRNKYSKQREACFYHNLETQHNANFYHDAVARTRHEFGGRSCTMLDKAHWNKK